MGFVYGDSGTPNKVGECSQRLHNALGRGAGLVTFIAFPGSGCGAQLGPNPQALIPIKVLMSTLKLRTMLPSWRRVWRWGGNCRRRRRLAL